MLGRDRAIEVRLLEPEQILAPREVVAGVLPRVDLRQRPEREAGGNGGDACKDQEGGA